MKPQNELRVETNVEIPVMINFECHAQMHWTNGNMEIITFYIRISSNPPIPSLNNIHESLKITTANSKNIIFIYNSMDKNNNFLLMQNPPKLTLAFTNNYWKTNIITWLTRLRKVKPAYILLTNEVPISHILLANKVLLLYNLLTN